MLLSVLWCALKDDWMVACSLVVVRIACMDGMEGMDECTDECLWSCLSIKNHLNKWPCSLCGALLLCLSRAPNNCEV